MDKSISSREYAIFLRTLRDARKRAGLNQTEVAMRIAETQSFVSKAERGERRLDVIEVRSFCIAIKIPFPDFIRDLDAVLTKQKPIRRKLK